jgi:hypothetical protein
MKNKNIQIYSRVSTQEDFLDNNKTPTANRRLNKLIKQINLYA